jgi:hypothetical protein
VHAVEKEDRLLYHQYVAGNYEEINLVGTLFACTVSQAKVKASIQVVFLTTKRNGLFTSSIQSSRDDDDVNEDILAKNSSALQISFSWN